MAVAAPLMLAALIAMPIVWAFMRLRRRPRRLVVPSLRLWRLAASSAAAPATARRQRDPLLWLTLALVLALVLAAAGLGLAATVQAPRHVFILLDRGPLSGRASRAAAASGVRAPRALDALLRAADRALLALGPDDRVTLASVPPPVRHPGVWASAAGAPGLRSALAQCRPAAHAGDFGAALDRLAGWLTDEEPGFTRVALVLAARELAPGARAALGERAALVSVPAVAPIVTAVRAAATGLVITTDVPGDSPRAMVTEVVPVGTDGTPAGVGLRYAWRAPPGRSQHVLPPPPESFRAPRAGFVVRHVGEPAYGFAVPGPFVIGAFGSWVSRAPARLGVLAGDVRWVPIGKARRPDAPGAPGAQPHVIVSDDAQPAAADPSLAGVPVLVIGPTERSAWFVAGEPVALGAEVEVVAPGHAVLTGVDVAGLPGLSRSARGRRAPNGPRRLQFAPGVQATVLVRGFAATNDNDGGGSSGNNGGAGSFGDGAGRAEPQAVPLLAIARRGREVRALANGIGLGPDGWETTVAAWVLFSNLLEYLSGMRVLERPAFTAAAAGTALRLPPGFALAEPRAFVPFEALEAVGTGDAHAGGGASGSGATSAAASDAAHALPIEGRFVVEQAGFVRIADARRKLAGVLAVNPANDFGQPATHAEPLSIASWPARAHVALVGWTPGLLLLALMLVLVRFGVELGRRAGSRGR